MNQNPIEDVLNELHFTQEQKEGFMQFIKYAKTCQETGDNNLLKSKLEEIVKSLVKNA